MYKDFDEDRNRGDFSVLPELHAVLSGMKVGSCRNVFRSIRSLQP